MASRFPRDVSLRSEREKWRRQYRIGPDMDTLEWGRMIEMKPSDAAVAVMCWDEGGKRLLGLMVVRRSDGHACFVKIPHELELRLETLDRKFVEDNAVMLLELAYEGLLERELSRDQVISRGFLQHGYHPATAGNMRYIPAELVAANPGGIATWQAAGFIVDIGEVDLARVRRMKTLH